LNHEFLPQADALPDADALRETALEVIAQLRLGIQKDGGDLQLVEIQGDRVFIRLSGACTTCAFAGQTLGGIRRHLMKATGWPVRVVPAT
jgi:NifU-like protein